MADYKITASPEAIRATTDKIESQRSYMENYMTEMQKKIDELQLYFKSDAGNEFVAKYASVSKNISSCLANLGNEITNLRNAAGIIEQGSQKVSGDVNNLSESSVFPNS